jgi:hypothetical protein
MNDVYAGFQPGTRKNLSEAAFIHQGIGTSTGHTFKVPGKKNTGSHFSRGHIGKSQHQNK